MKCGFCFIDQRGENTLDPILSPSDYGFFISSVLRKRKIEALCVQGHEPLLPAAFKYTKKILEVGRNNDISTSLVTNGTYLSQYAFQLAQLKPKYLAVSLDSSEAERHDKLRSLQGSFKKIVHGLQIASEIPGLRSALSVTSVLMPNRLGYLLGMPSLLANLGISRWVINALTKVGSEDIGGPVGDLKKTLKDLEVLNDEARRHNIILVVDDEFSQFLKPGTTTQLMNSRNLRVERLRNPGGLLRLAPDGQCSVGVNIMKQVPDSAEVWSPKGKEDPSLFVDRLLKGVQGSIL